MIYFYQNKQVLSMTELGKESLFYPDDINDLRNYAITIVYKNEVEQIARNSSIYLHLDYFRLLYKKSQKLQRRILKRDLNNLLHETIDDKLLANSNAIFYHNYPDEKERENFGILCLPSELNQYQKQFFCECLKYLEVYDEFILGRYNPNTKMMEDLNEFGDGLGVSVLKKIVQ